MENFEKEIALVNIIRKANIEAIEKSVSDDFQKGKAANIGEIRTWSGKKYKKQTNGKWVEVSEHGMTKEEHSKKVNELASKKGEEIGYAHHSKQSSKLSDKEHSDEEVGVDNKEDHQFLIREAKEKYDKFQQAFLENPNRSEEFMQKLKSYREDYEKMIKKLQQ